MLNTNRIFLIVLDSMGIGKAHDAAKFNDEGSDTLKSICTSKYYNTPNLQSLGLFNIDNTEGRDKCENPKASFARLVEKSMGKDTTIGHWEIAGAVSPKPLPTYPNGFPKEVLDEFTKRTGRQVLCNLPYSGTDVIRDYGDEHVKTGALIVYTSADSVFQIAAHEDIVPVETLYEYCRIAREILTGEHSVGRVIARPFIGESGNYKRTSRRHDFSLLPPKKTMLNFIDEEGLASIGVGKINDIFAGSGINRDLKVNTDNHDGMVKTLKLMDEDFHGLCFVNLVDFDMLYGHRNDIDGYAKAMTEFDGQLGEFLEKMKDDDVLIITADHGCDPGTPSTDHSRENVPMLIYGKNIPEGINLGTRDSYADISASVLKLLDLDKYLDKVDGKEFITDITK